MKIQELKWIESPSLGGRRKLVALDCFGNQFRRIDLPAHDVDALRSAAQSDYEARIRSALVEVPAVKGEPEPVAWPANLNPRTLDLVQRFALALAKKLRLAEEKYGHTDGWSRDDWEAECRDHLYQHLEKGDPRDVAAYCAFMWHHGWITYRPEPVASKRPVAFRVRQHRLSNHYELYTDEKDAQFWANDRGIDYEGLYLVADRYTAPPADAGMREALSKVCIYRVEDDASIHLLVDGEKIGAFGQHTSKAMALLRLEACLRDACIDAALTAPGATTKSDGGKPHAEQLRTALQEMLRLFDSQGNLTGDFQAIQAATEAGYAALSHILGAGK